MDVSARWTFRIAGPVGGIRSVAVSKSLIIGRDADADLRLEDSSVSRRHARVSLSVQGGLEVEDLGSANGVWVGEARIADKVAVGSGAVIKVGLYTLTAHLGEGAFAEDRAAVGTAPPPVAILRFKTGPLGGRDVALARKALIVGRNEEGNDIVVPDESMSRRHAQLLWLGDGYELKDLRSANGTWINGVRTVTGMLRNGDRVKFGMVEAEFLEPNARRTQLSGRLLKGVTAGSMAALIVLGAVEGIRVWRGEAATVRPEQHVEGSWSVASSLAEAKRERDGEHWERALQAYQQALAQDPVNPEIRKGIREVKLEIDTKLLFDRARQRVDVGQEEEGIEAYLEVSPASSYYPRARAEVRRLAELLKRHYDEQCQRSQEKRDPQSILSNCSHFLNLVCNGASDQARLAVVRAAERKLGSKNRNPRWTCPPAYAGWLKDDVPSTAGASLQAK